MTKFINKYRNKITGVLNGFDRIVFRGMFRNLLYVGGMTAFLNAKQILLKKFDDYVKTQTDFLRSSLYQYVEELQRPSIYLESSATRKEDVVKEVLQGNPIDSGLICLLKCVEPCMSYSIYKNSETKKLELKLIKRKCLHLYFYYNHEKYGLLHVRLQTWFPFTIQICMNGREWLSRQMDKNGISYKKQENCFITISDIKKANKLMQDQVRKDFPRILNTITKDIVKPVKKIVGKLDHYWTLHQSEWATDIMFNSQDSLGKIYPQLVRNSFMSFSSENIMRYLGKKLTSKFQKELISDYKKRPEGIRIKYIFDANFLKMYDKKGILLRIESVINKPDFFKVFRTPEDKPFEELRWLPLRKGVADVKRRIEISQKINERYLNALASIDTERPVKDIVDDICSPAYLNEKRIRALRPWSSDDNELLKTIGRGEFQIGGFRNKDLRGFLFSDEENANSESKRKFSSAVTRKIRMLRAHGLVTKVLKTNRYMLTEKGRRIVSAILEYQNISLKQIYDLAA